MVAIRHLGFVWGIFGSSMVTMKSIWWSVCAKFGWDQRSSFDNMKVLVFARMA